MHQLLPVALNGHIIFSRHAADTLGWAQWHMLLLLLLLMASFEPIIVLRCAANILRCAHWRMQRFLSMALFGPIAFSYGAADALGWAHLAHATAAADGFARVYFIFL
jgi:hypothetical protein